MEEFVAGEFGFGFVAEFDGVGEGGHSGGDAAGINKVLIGDLEFPGNAPGKVSPKIGWKGAGVYS